MNCCLLLLLLKKELDSLLPVNSPLLSLYLVPQTWWDFNHTFKMVLDGEHVDPAVYNENDEGRDGGVNHELVESGMKDPYTNSNLKTNVYMFCNIVSSFKKKIANF